MSSSILQPGFRVAKYEILAHIATGGMGEVYKAVDHDLERTVALKVLPARLAKNGPALERFRREARHAARLVHSNIVTLFEFGHDADHDLHYLALEFIDGINLEEYIARRGRLQPEEARRILIKVTRALDHAYEQGVVHRDIKPANILLARMAGKVAIKLTDLGLARVQDDQEFKVTREGSTVGTVDYMSPEQARNSQATDARSDIYSLGCTAYHMLAGRAPFAEGGLGERVYKHMTALPPDVRQFNPAVSAAFWSILLRMLAKEPDDRYAKPSDLLSDLKCTPSTVAEHESAFEPDAQLGEPSSAPTAPLPSSFDAWPVPPSSGHGDPNRTTAGSMPTPRPDPAPTPFPADTSTPQTEAPAKPPAAPKPAAFAGLTRPGSAQELVTPEQQQTAAAFHKRARQVLADRGEEAYALQLLRNCVKLDPFNRKYRKDLRLVNRKASGGVLGRLLGTLNVLTLKSKVRAARAVGDWRKALELGEEVLAHEPTDVDTHIEMAQVVADLGLSHQAMWLLEQGRKEVRSHPDLLRMMARLHEELKQYGAAIKILEQVCRLVPDDYDSRRKLDQLCVQVHLTRSLRRQ